MCGRYSLHTRIEALAKHFKAEIEDIDPSAIQPRYNIAPTQGVLVVREDADKARRVLDIFTWGLIPHWSKTPLQQSGFINARSETITSKAAFKDPVRYRRCLIPADGYFEWRAKGDVWYFFSPNHQPLAFAGIWDDWLHESGSQILSTAILTITANGDCNPIHQRMPVILPPQHWDAWLDPHIQDPSAVTPLLNSAPDGTLLRHQVSSTVGNVRVDSPELIIPNSNFEKMARSPQQTLFDW